MEGVTVVTRGGWNAEANDNSSIGRQLDATMAKRTVCVCFIILLYSLENSLSVGVGQVGFCKCVLSARGWWAGNEHVRTLLVSTVNVETNSPHMLTCTVPPQQLGGA